jgi:nucleotide-binding universal stress UspA family protein
MEFSRILIPVVGDEADKEALDLGCRLAKKTESKIYIIHVISISRELPLDAEVESEISKAEDILTQTENQTKDCGCQIETELLQAREVGPAIIDEAIERDIDLIILGVSYKTRFGEFCLGEVIPHVLRNAPCRVILFQQRAD